MSPLKSRKLRIVAVSDTHLRHNELEIEGTFDALIVAGDATNGNFYSIKSLGDWMRTVDADLRLFVPGNNDILFHKNPVESIKYLGDEVMTMSCGDTILEFDKIRIFGSPMTPQFGERDAFSFSDSFRKAYWKRRERINEKIDILVTHCPPKGYLDSVGGVNAGCEFLSEYVNKIRPAAHIFGHIHEGFGRLEGEATTFFNVSSFRKRDCPLNKPTIINLEVLR